MHLCNEFTINLKYFVSIESIENSVVEFLKQIANEFDFEI